MAGIDLSGYGGDIFGSSGASIPDVSGGFDYSVPTFSGFTSGDFGGAANFDSGSNWVNQYSPDLSSNYDWNFAPTNRVETDQGYFMPQEYKGMDITPAPAESSPWTTALNNLIASPDAMVKLGLGGLGALGNMYSQMQTNKMNKKAMKNNAKYDAYRAAAMERAQKNAAIADKYNNSYDTTTAATAKYTPLTREQAMTYGETGAPHQQIEITPGVTTRNYLAEGGFAHGGQADTIPAMLSEGEFVIPADVVSILGDGNSRAGGSALQQMMQQIRAGAGRTNTKSIPAKAKPATAYLKGKK
jgi:hypothetical protein